MHLYAIRHGQSFSNLPEWDGINPDPALTPVGEKQASALASWLPTYVPHVDAVYCSSLRRPLDTALPLAAAYHLDIRVDHRLRELGDNRIDHTPYPEGGCPGRDKWADPRWLHKPFAAMTKYVDGESLMHFRLRVASFVEEAVEQHAGEHVVAICHNAVIGAIFQYCFATGPWTHCSPSTSNTGLTHFEYKEDPIRGPWHLHVHNMVEHLRIAGCELT